MPQVDGYDIPPSGRSRRQTGNTQHAATGRPLEDIVRNLTSASPSMHSSRFRPQGSGSRSVRSGGTAFVIVIVCILVVLAFVLWLRPKDTVASRTNMTYQRSAQPQPVQDEQSTFSTSVTETTAGGDQNQNTFSYNNSTPRLSRKEYENLLSTSEQYNQADRELGNAWSILMSKVNTVAKRDLRNRQIEWIGYRDETALKAGQKGSSAHVETLVRLTSERTQALKETLNNVENGWGPFAAEEPAKPGNVEERSRLGNTSEQRGGRTYVTFNNTSNNQRDESPSTSMARAFRTGRVEAR